MKKPLFSNGRPKLGLPVFASESAKGLMAERIWLSVEEVNAQNKPWTRAERDVIVVLLLGMNCPKTDKQNIIRPQVYRRFEALINHKHEGVDESEILEPYGEH